MEISTEVSTAPNVTKSESSFAESSQETKVEKIANGSIETAASSEKTVTQSVQSSVSNSGVEEVKQESSSSSFSSSSVTVDENSSTSSNAIEASTEDVNTVIEKTDNAESQAKKNVEEVQQKESEQEAENKSEDIEESKAEVQNESEVKQEPQSQTEVTGEIQNEPKVEENLQTEPEVKEKTQSEPEVKKELPNEPVIKEEIKNEQEIKEEPQIKPEVKEQEQIIAPTSDQNESKVEQDESVDEIAPNSHNILNSSVVNSDEQKQTEIQSNECDEKQETAVDGSLPTVPEEEPKVEPVAAQAPVEPEVKVKAAAPVAFPSFESLPIASIAPSAPIEEQQQSQPDIVTQQQQQYSSKEIEQESIKKQLNEIITDIEKNVQITNDDATENSNDGGEGKKPIDLQKIFTPANDVDEIKPGTNRKLFASSSFYSPAIHPTVEDQVELARRISHSLSDISNQQSKGQSMYVNRKKRSVKWIHDDDGQEERYVEEHHSTKENGFETSSQHIEHSTSAIPPEEPKKVPLKLVMDPRHVQDFNSMRQFGYEQIAPMSPEFGLELCNALNSSNEKGAELFAKRRKKAEKWVVDGSKQQQQATTPTAGTQFLPAFSEAGIQRVQHNMKLDQIQEKYINQHPSIQMVRSPWEAALETGNVDNAFVTSNQQSNQQQQQMYQSSIIDYGSTASPSSSLYSSNKKETQYQSSKQFSGRDLAYKPSVPQGWNREIKLQSETDEIALENEMQEIYEAQKSYMELIRDFTPTPPLVEYEVKCGDVETNVYEEPIKELMVECDTRESTPEYQTVPVKALINNFEQGMFVAPEIPASFSTTSSVTSEKFSKFSSTTSTSFQDVFSSESTNFKQEQQSAVKQPQQPAPAPFKPQQQQFAPVQQTTPKPYQPTGQSFPPLKPQTPVSFNKPQTPVNVAPAPKPQQQASAVSPAPTKSLTPISIPSPRSGLNASPVTPGILKKQIQLDAAVPVPPGGVVGNSQSPVPSFNGRLSGKSPVPFVNTAPAPFNPQFPPLSVQTPETIAQIAPNETPLVPPLRNPAEIPMPLIVSTPLPKYSNCYNNAARPFNEFKDYYKPIHMEEGKKLLPPLIYTDF